MKGVRYSTLTNLTLLLAGLVVAWGAAEGIAWISTRGAQLPPGSDEGLYAVERDPLYGYQLLANNGHTALKLQPNGDPCYRAVYHTDQFRRRTVGTAPRPGRPHLLLFGCSVTFGEGLNDYDTLQYQLAEQLPDVEVYNYAVSGWGPSHALAKLRSGELKREVPAHAGSAVYVVIPAHVSRVIVDTRSYWLFDAPDYYWGPDGAVTGGLPFRQMHPWRTRFYEALLAAKRHSWLLPALHVDWPLRLSDTDVRLTAAVLAAARQSYRQQFDGEFFVVLHPSWDLGASRLRDLHEKLTRFLKERGVPVLDYASDNQSASDVINPDCDWHPNGRLNQRLAARLANDLLERAPARTMPPAGTLVLVYHRISADPSAGNPETVSVPNFEEQMQELSRRGYRTISLAELHQIMSGNSVAANKTVLLTFDDGWKSQSLALPILRRLGFKASFAIFPGKGLGWDYFEWSDIEAIDTDPLFEIFSHSLTHPWARGENLVTWSDGKSATHGASDVDIELVESKRLLEKHLKRPIEDFAWPSGWYNKQLIERASAAGYKGLLTIEPGTNSTGDDPRRIKRVMVDGLCSLEQFRDILEHHRYPSCSEAGPLEHRRSPYSSFTFH
jgi:peptidoglycan/xylan/chitin deacetylase (PgdA/CDA1 family)